MSILIGLLIGGVLGLTGAGGSVIAVPLLMLLLGLPSSDAMGVALGAVCIAASFGTIAKYKHIPWPPTLILAVSGMMTAPIGKYYATVIDDGILVGGFVFISILISLRMLNLSITRPETMQHLRANLNHDDSQEGRQLNCRLSPTGEFQLRPKCLTGLTFGGCVIGFISGLLGVGAGFLIVPLILYLSAISMPRAVASSLAIISLVSGSGFLGHVALTGMKDFLAISHVLIGALLGMILSLVISQKLSGVTLQKVFAYCLLASSTDRKSVV